MECTITTVGVGSELLDQVIDLWSPNRKTLGFFPRGAFEEYAGRGGIVGARAGDSLLGYVAFRETDHWIVIVHLCVAPPGRKQGVARALIKWLRSEHQLARGMKLSCRRDFEAHRIWPRFGFRAAGERAAKAEGEQIIEWRLDFRSEAELFDWSAAQRRRRLRVGIDQNVFLDLYGADDVVRRDHESEILLADWLSTEVELFVTDETFNEISQMNASDAERQRLRACADRHRRPHCEAQAFEDRSAELQTLLPPEAVAGSGADVRHLARAVVGGFACFLTRDDAILETASQIEDRYGLRVLRPLELALDIDQLLRAEEYAPRRLAGTLHKARRATSQDLDDLEPSFRESSSGERRTDFERTLRACLDDPKGTRLEICSDPDGAKAALIATASDETSLRIRMLRVTRDRIAPTLLRYQIERMIRRSAQSGLACVRISDRFLSSDGKTAAAEAGFLPVGEEWIKIQLHGFHTPEELGERAESAFRTLAGDVPKLDLSAAEHLFRPAKIRGAQLPCFIIPIRPTWAALLFEERMAQELLFGARPDLVFSPEFAYYRAAQPRGVRAPARVLWYVSQGQEAVSGFSGRMMVRAYSRIDEVMVGKPKELFRRFKRLGIYEWDDVFETAKKDLNREIMAIRCVDTELLPHPIPWDELQKYFQAHLGAGNPLVSAVEIPESLFETLYLRSFQGSTA